MLRTQKWTNRWWSLLVLGVLAIVLALFWQQVQGPPIIVNAPPSDLEQGIMSSEPIQPIPLQIELDDRKVALGQRLFEDRLLSQDQQVSCASCHFLDKGGADGLAKSIGVHGEISDTNTSTVFNTQFNFKLHWIGQFETLTDQIGGVINDPKTMGIAWKTLLARLKEVPAYQGSFQQIYSDGITSFNVEDAIATYEQSLTTPNGRFDRFLRGDAQALSKDELEGYGLFKEYGCVSCHQGINVGGNMFQKFGVLGNYFADRGHITPADRGRFNLTGQDSDRYTFRVPSLRNVALTAPYFHDGSVKSLRDAVQIMAHYQLGRPLSDEAIEYIVLFLHTLTGEYQGKPL